MRKKTFSDRIASLNDGHEDTGLGESLFWLSILRATDTSKKQRRRSLNQKPLSPTDEDGEEDCFTIMRKPTTQSAYHVVSDMIDSDIVEQFDLTTSSVQALYKSFCTDGKETLTHDEFRVALAQQGLLTSTTRSSNSNFERLIRIIDEDNDGIINFGEYSACIQKLKLANLIIEEENRNLATNNVNHSTGINVLEYSNAMASVKFHIKDPKEFLYGEREKEWAVRWVHIEGDDKYSMLQMATKYRLHPMHLVDALSMHKQQPKFRTDDGLFFVIFMQMHLTSRSLRVLQEFMKDKSTKKICPHRPNSIVGIFDERTGDVPPMLIETVQCPLVAFVTPGPEYKTVVTVRGEWELPIDHYSEARSTETKNTPDYVFTQNNMKGDVKAEISKEARLDPTVISSISTMYGEGFFTTVLRKIRDPHSTVRRGNGARLLYSILDACVTTIKPILQCYQIQLAWFRQVLDRDRTRFLHVKALMCYKRQLWEMKVMLGPCRKVTSHVMGLVDEQLRDYFEDVDDELDTSIETINIYIGVCEELSEEYRHYNDKQLNDILLILTVVTTVLLPIQLITGIFGTNFVDLEPFMESSYGLGYTTAIGTALTIMLTVAFYSYLYKKNISKKAREAMKEALERSRSLSELKL